MIPNTRQPQLRIRKPPTATMMIIARNETGTWTKMAQISVQNHTAMYSGKVFLWYILEQLGSM